MSTPGKKISREMVMYLDSVDALGKYNAGMSQEDVARKVAASKSTVGEYLRVKRGMGAEVRARRKPPLWSVGEIEHLLRLYKAGKKVLEIAKAMRRTKSAVSLKLWRLKNE